MDYDKLFVHVHVLTKTYDASCVFGSMSVIDGFPTYWNVTEPGRNVIVPPLNNTDMVKGTST